MFRLTFTAYNVLGFILGHTAIYTLQFKVQMLDHMEERCDKHEACFFQKSIVRDAIRLRSRSTFAAISPRMHGQGIDRVSGFLML